MKRIIISLILLLSFLFSKEYLVVVKIEEASHYDNLNNLKEFIPVALLDYSVIGRISEQDLNKLTNFHYQILYPIELKDNEAFYLLYYPKENEDLSLIKKDLENYCEVLYNEGQTFLVKIDLAKISSLREFELCYLSLRPIILPKSDEIIWESKKPEILNISQPNPIIQEVIDRITPSELAELIRQLSGEKKCFVLGDSDSISTRYATTQKNSRAIYWFYENLLSFNLDSVIFDPFSHSQGNDSNVIGVKKGRIYPDIYFIVGGHIDNTSESPQTYAPGADDNASGVLTALIAAKYLKDIPFKYTIKFMAWNAEELGLYGSQAHSQRVRLQGDSILGVLNSDMIACEISNLDSVRIYTGQRITSRAIGDTAFVVNQRYNIGLNVRRSTYMQANSDHYPYYQQGYNSVHFFEDDFCPDYHTTRDRINSSWFDTIYYCKVVKLVVATLATLAIPDTEISYLSENKIISSKKLNKGIKGEIYNIFGQKIKRENIKKGIYYLKEDIDFRKIILLK
ncbi:MAG: M28 family metallopeptidase [candidate division WOR-3 bacterium]